MEKKTITDKEIRNEIIARRGEQVWLELKKIYSFGAAEQWMMSRNKALDGQVPLQMLQTQEGTDRVLAVIAALSEGAFL